MARKPKRRSCVHFPADLTQAARGSSLDVDIFILDYLAYNALSAHLDNIESSSTHHVKFRLKVLRRQIKMVDSFLKIFRSRHPREVIPQTTRFRLSMLRFCRLLLAASHLRRHDRAVLYRQPSTHLAELRRSNRERAESWWRLRRSQGQAVSQDGDKAEALAQSLERIDRSSHSGSTDNGNEGPDPTLLDLLPLFIRLIYDKIHVLDELHGKPAVMKKPWLGFAVEFMKQAFLEQRVVFGAEGCSALLESFAWGPNGDDYPEGEQDGEGQQHDDIQEVFLVEENEDSDIGSSTTDEIALSAKDFNYSRDQAIVNLDPSTFAADFASPESISSFFERLFQANSMDDPSPRVAFEQSIWSFLRNLSVSAGLPLLVQLEEVQSGARTQVDADRHRLTHEQTEQLRLLWCSR